jgi:hypothetical protein
MAKRFLTPIGILNLASDPATGSDGQIYYNSTSDILKIYVNGAWTAIEGGGGAAINVSASAPVSPEEGDAWFDNTDGKFYVYDGSFWVETGQTDAAFASYNRWTKVISASTVNITGLDDNSTNLDYSPGLEQVYINGVFIDESSYTATSGSAIVLDEAVLPTDLVEVLWLENLVVADTYSKAESDAKYLSLTTASSNYLTILSASTTYATKTELNNINLTSAINTASAAAFASASAYTNSQINALTTTDIEEGTNLYFTNSRAINAGSATYILQTNQQGIINSASAAAVTYLVDSAPSTLDTLNELAAALGDDPNYATTITNSLSEKLSISTASATYLTQSSASTTYATQAELAAFSSEEFLIKAEAYTAVAGDVVFVNSASGAYTITLPASPTLGDKVRIIDLANNAATNNITAGRNGNNIDGSASNFTIDINNAGVEFIYTNATYGWRTING